MTTPTPPLWPGPRLLLPMVVDALVVGTPDQSSQTWVNLTIDYSRVYRAPRSSPPTPFAPATAPGTGVHLLWTLPNAFRSGHTAASGAVEFPLAPNRWIVVRSYMRTPTSTPALLAWVVESDFRGDFDTGTNPYPDPDSSGQVQFIGRVTPLAAWTGDGGGASPYLRAVAPGDVAYSAVYANVGNVFGFHDPLGDDVQGAYTYMVCGWYDPTGADPLLGASADDPLGWTTQDAWAALMQSFAWQVGDGSQQALSAAQAAWTAWKTAQPAAGVPPAQLALPAQTLSHGMVYGIPWRGSARSYTTDSIPGGPGAVGVDVAVGNNPSEAIAAWVANKLTPADDPTAPQDIAALERLLLAFQSDAIFDFLDDPVAFEAQLHAGGFASHGGGTVWRVVSTPDADEAGDADQTVTLSVAATDALVALNARQRAADRLSDALQTQRWSLYAAWYKLGVANASQKPAVQRGITHFKAAVAATQTALTSAQAAVTTALAALVAALGLPPGALADDTWTIRTRDDLAYQSPSDPVVLVAGADVDDKFSRQSDDSTLMTRLSGQFVAGMALDFAGHSATLTAAAIQAALAGALPRPTAPARLLPEVTAMWSEMLLLDPSAAGFLAQLFFTTVGVTPTAQQLADLTLVIAKIQTATANAAVEPTLDHEVVAEAVGLVGTPPAPLAVQAWTRAPWTPLYLDWQVQWFPDPGDPTWGPDSLADHWQLEEIDLAWRTPAIGATVQVYTGRTLLNTQSALGLQQKLQQFLAHSPNLGQLAPFQIKELGEIADQMGKADIITQSLTGLTRQLMMRQPAIIGPVSDADIDGALGDDTDARIPAVLTPFYPLRAGHLLINKLWVVDVFGRRLPATPDGTNVTPYRAESMLTPGAGNQAYVQLPPRYTQPARLALTLLQADDDTRVSGSSSLTSPIAGYLVPNFIDGSLTVFDPQGDNLGSVQPLTGVTGGDAAVRWDAVPGALDPLGSPPNVRNPHVRALVDGLLQAGLAGQPALDGLLDVMDATEFAADPRGVLDTGNLAALASRPLAVVRASVAIELHGDPAYDESLATADQQATHGFTGVDFFVRVGDLGFKKNGVVGYFVDDDYTKFYAVYGYAPTASELRLAVARGPAALSAATLAAPGPGAPAPGGGYVVQDHVIRLPASVAGSPVVHLTILVSPRGMIPAVSGALPVVQVALDPGPVTAALQHMDITFRTGPLLTDPKQLAMPLPADIRGTWSWVQRRDVTTWSDSDVAPETGNGDLVARPLRLSQGWLKLSGAMQPVKP